MGLPVTSTGNSRSLLVFQLEQLVQIILLLEKFCIISIQVAEFEWIKWPPVWNSKWALL